MTVGEGCQVALSDISPNFLSKTLEALSGVWCGPTNPTTITCTKHKGMCIHDVVGESTPWTSSGRFMVDYPLYDKTLALRFGHGIQPLSH
jgi:hypothetical protein